MRIYDGDRDQVPVEGTPSSSSRATRRPVGVAEYAITVDDVVLVTSGLGSCVAVGLSDGENAAGLLHVMLPTADGRPVENPAKFADTGIELVVTELEAMGIHRADLVAKIAGGSEMIAFDSQARSIGERNVEAVRLALEALDIPLAGEDVGGDEGRTVEFTVDGTLAIRSAGAGRRRL